MPLHEVHPGHTAFALAVIRDMMTGRNLCGDECHPNHTALLRKKIAALRESLGDDPDLVDGVSTFDASRLLEFLDEVKFDYEQLEAAEEAPNISKDDRLVRMANGLIADFKAAEDRLDTPERRRREIAELFDEEPNGRTG